MTMLPRMRMALLGKSHPRWADAETVLSAIRARPGANALRLCSRAVTRPLFAGLDAVHLSVDQVLTEGDADPSARPGGIWNICVCELSPEDARRASAILSAAMPLLAAGAEIFIVCQAESDTGALTVPDVAGHPGITGVRTVYSGTDATVGARAAFESALNRVRSGSLGERVQGLRALADAAGQARRANLDAAVIRSDDGGTQTAVVVAATAAGERAPRPAIDASREYALALLDNARLVRHIRMLRDQNEDLSRQLEEKSERDYQILMTHQGILAGIADMEPEFAAFYERCKPFTMTSVERLYSLFKCIEYVVRRGIPGDIVETGVWRGGSCMMAALALRHFGDTSRRLFLFDTFAGHPQPDAERDVDLWGNPAIRDWEKYRHADGSTEWGLATIEDARRNLESTGYPADKLVFVKGKVEDTVPGHVPDAVALLRLDTDWYESSRVSLERLYPKLATGGVLVVDDYGHYKGQRQAVDEYFAARGEAPLLHRIDYSCRVAVKA